MSATQGSIADLPYDILNKILLLLAPNDYNSIRQLSRTCKQLRNKCYSFMRDNLPQKFGYFPEKRRINEDYRDVKPNLEEFTINYLARSTYPYHRQSFYQKWQLHMLVSDGWRSCYGQDGQIRLVSILKSYEAYRTRMILHLPSGVVKKGHSYWRE